jgi:hypothetical protein
MTALKAAATLSGASLRQVILSALDAQGISYSVHGREVEADLEGTGHRSYKINTEKGLWFCTDGSGRSGGYRALRSLIGGVLPADHAPLTVAADAAKEKAAADKAAIAEAKNLWKSGWLPQKNGDLPLDWADGANNATQRSFRRSQLTEALDAVNRYLASRTYNPAHALRLGRIGRSQYGQPALLWPMRSQGGGISCVQEVVLRSDGSKARYYRGRPSGAALGVPAPEGMAPAKLPGIDGPALVAGEGVETILAPVQAAGLPGIVTFDAHGLVTWAKQQAQIVARTPGASTPHVLVTVDNDISETGQKAAARSVMLLRAAGIKASFVIPPAPEEGGPKGGPKGSDWGDYPKEGIAPEVLVQHLRMQVARADELMAPWVAAVEKEDGAMAEDWAKVADGGEVPLSLDPWVRRAQTLAAMAETMPLDIARREVRRLLDEIVKQAKKRKDDKEAGKKVERALPYLLQISTGVGKSTVARAMLEEMRAMGLRVAILAKDKLRAAEYEGVGAFYLHGREPIREDGKRQDWSCQKMFEAEILPVVEAHHSIARTSCQHCPAGAKYQYAKCVIEGRKPSEAVIRMLALPNASNYAPCDYLQHVDQAKDEQIVVMVPQSAGETILQGRDLIIVDEGVDPVDVANVSADGLSDTVARLSAMIFTRKNAHVPVSDESEGYTVEEIERIRADFINVQAAIIREDRDAVIAAAHAIKKVIKRKTTQDWEQPLFLGEKLHEAPLRLAEALTDGADSLEIQGQVLHVPYGRPLMDAIKRTPTMLLDATPSMAIRDLVKGVGGTHHKMIAECLAEVVVDPSRSFGALPKDATEEARDADAEALAERLRQAKATNPRTFMVATKDRALRVLWLMGAREALPQGVSCSGPADLGELPKDILWRVSVDLGVGWWGWHDSAHDEWSGWDEILVGQPALPRAAILDEYVRYAATMRWAGLPCDMGNPDLNTIDADCWLATGEYEQRALGRAVYKDRTVLDLVLDKANNARIQAIGRSRPAANKVQITLLGGLPLTSAPEHGIALRYARVLGPTRAERAAAQHKAAKARYTAAAGQAIRQGVEITRDNLDRICRESVRPAIQKDNTHGGTNGADAGTAPRRATYSEWLDQFLDALAPSLAARGQRGGDVLRARARLESASESDRLAAELAWKAMMEQGLSADAALNRLMDAMDDPHSAGPGERVLADLLWADAEAERPEGHDLTR